MQLVSFHILFHDFQLRCDGPGWLSRYSDSLRAGRSRDRIPMGARFSAPVQTGPGAHPASCTMGTGSFPGVKRPGRGAGPHPIFQCRDLRKSTAISLPTLRALVACYRENLYLVPSVTMWRTDGRTFLCLVQSIFQAEAYPHAFQHPCLNFTSITLKSAV